MEPSFDDEVANTTFTSITVAVFIYYYYFLIFINALYYYKGAKG